MTFHLLVVMARRAGPAATDTASSGGGPMPGDIPPPFRGVVAGCPVTGRILGQDRTVLLPVPSIHQTLA